MGKLTESEYTTIKQLLSKGYEGKKVAEIMQRGAGTVSTVKNTANYEDYKQRLLRQPEAPKKQTELPLDKPKKTTLDLREDIAIKLSALLDAVVAYETSIPRFNGSIRSYKSRCCNVAKMKIEEARLWLKETF